MLTRPEHRLAALNVAVFTCVLVAFALCVYVVVVDGIKADVKTRLSQLTDSAIASIDYDYDPARKIENAAPDVLADELPDSQWASLRPLKMQWFDYSGKLKLQKGTFNVSVPLQEGYQEQANPHGMVFTKAVTADGRLLGHVRIAEPLEQTDRLIQHLQIGLALAIIVSALISGAGIVVLVGQAMRPLELSIRQLRQFVADASHELRNPVMAIQSNAAVALKYTEGMRETDREKFHIILNCVEQMGRLTNDLLCLARNEKQEQAIGTGCVTDALTNACTMLVWLAEKRNISLTKSIEPDLFARGLEDELQRIFSNLIENALVYTPEGGLVKVTASKIQNQILVEVSDNGIGISEQDRKKIFDRFWRADKARTHSSGGNGLGLSICSALVKKFGGWIGVSSELEKGSTFSVHLISADVQAVPPMVLSITDNVSTK